MAQGDPRERFSYEAGRPSRAPSTDPVDRRASIEHVMQFGTRALHPRRGFGQPAPCTHHLPRALFRCRDITLGPCGQRWSYHHLPPCAPFSCGRQGSRKTGDVQENVRETIPLELCQPLVASWASRTAIELPPPPPPVSALLRSAQLQKKTGSTWGKTKRILFLFVCVFFADVPAVGGGAIWPGKRPPGHQEPPVQSPLLIRASTHDLPHPT